MITVLLRTDRSGEAKRLRETIVAESEAILAKLEAAFTKAIEVGMANTYDPRFKAVLQIANEHDAWYMEKQDEIKRLRNTE